MTDAEMNNYFNDMITSCLEKPDAKAYVMNMMMDLIAYGKCFNIGPIHIPIEHVSPTGYNKLTDPLASPGEG